MYIINRIEELRNQRGWSIYKLAMEAGITQSTLTNMFSRGTLPSITTLSSICDAFEITLAQFFYDGNGEELTDEEFTLLSDFRKLSEKNKQAVLGLIKSLK